MKVHRISDGITRHILTIVLLFFCLILKQKIMIATKLTKKCEFSTCFFLVYETIFTKKFAVNAKHSYEIKRFVVRGLKKFEIESK